MENNNGGEKSQRVVTFLNREEVDYLDKLGKDALFTTGLKLSRAKLIAWLVNYIRNLNISGQNMKSEHDLATRIQEVLMQKGSVTSFKAL